MLSSSCNKEHCSPQLSEIQQQLVNEARHRTTMESQIFQSAIMTTWNRDLANGAISYIKAHPDHSAYLLLFAMKRTAASEYTCISPAIKSKIIVSALESMASMNDWGSLSPTDSYDGEAARELIGLGCWSKRNLLPILHDKNTALLVGSEEATLSRIYHYRRCDFAFRYLQLIDGLTPKFSSDIPTRDKQIDDYIHGQN